MPENAEKTGLYSGGPLSAPCALLPQQTRKEIGFQNGPAISMTYRRRIAVSGFFLTAGASAMDCEFGLTCFPGLTRRLLPGFFVDIS